MRVITTVFATAAFAALLAGCAVQRARDNLAAAEERYDACLDAHAPAIAAQHLPREDATLLLMDACRAEGRAYQFAVDDYNDARRDAPQQRSNALGAAALLHQMGQDARSVPTPPTRVNVTVTPWSGIGPPPPP